MSNNGIQLWEIYIFTVTGQRNLMLIYNNESVANLLDRIQERYRDFQGGGRFTVLAADGSQLQDDDPRRLIDVGCLSDKCSIRLVVGLHPVGDGLPRTMEAMQLAPKPAKVPSPVERTKIVLQDSKGLNEGLASVKVYDRQMAGSVAVIRPMSRYLVQVVPLPGFIETTTAEPDMLGLDEEGTVLAKMPCGHVIGPNSMASYCQSVLSSGQFKFYCPSVDKRTGKANCNREWDYFLVRHVASLSPDELKECEKKFTVNYLERSQDNQTCPKCGAWCYKRQGNGNYVGCPMCGKNFCWACMRDWIGASDGESCGNLDCDGGDLTRRLLARCPTKEIGRCPACPVMRACPKCGMLIEHKDACGHVTCTDCSNGFCFICLKGMKNKHDWRCSPSGDCALAPRQTNQAGSRKRCSIM